MRNKVQKTSSQLDNYSWSYDFWKMQEENEIKIEKEMELMEII